MPEASATPPSRSRHVAASAACCAIAGIAATYLSGLNFPEANNVWHIPVVLDLGNSLEGPHDLYHRSFSKFVSAFWLLVRQVTTESNIGTVFPIIQLLGNMMLSLSLFALVVQATRSAARSALVVSGLSVCYGLWGVTRLGGSELFITYATHTQFSIVLCLLALCLLLAGRPAWSGVVLSLAADANLFMAGWTGLAAGLYLVASERRVPTRSQLALAGTFLVLSIPIAVWALRSGSASSSLPPGFFRDHIPGHVYALTAPQAAIQTLMLGLAAGLAAAFHSDAGRIRRLGLLMLASVAALVAGSIMPYVTDTALLLQLNPLRFTSVLTLLAAAAAAALLVLGLDRKSPDGAIFLFVAVLGFGLKSPVVSILGLSFALPPSLRWAGLVLSATAGLATLIPGGMADGSPKAQLAFLLLCAVLAVAMLRRPALPAARDDASWLSTIAAWATIAAVPGVGPWPILLASAGLPAAFLPKRAPSWMAPAANAAAIVLAMTLGWTDASRMLPVAAGLCLLIAGAFLCRLHSLDAVRIRWAGAAAAASVFVMAAAGLAKGAQAGFAVQHSAETQAFLSAEAWARANTPPDTMFDFWRRDRDGFSLFSRRPIWWEAAQIAGALWEPALYPIWQCRSTAIEAARSDEAREDVALRANVEYLIYRNGPNQPVLRHFVPAYANATFGIARRGPPKSADPLCPEP